LKGVLNIVSEHFIEAANATAINSPYGVSEWNLSGLHPEKCTYVKPPRVKESIFAAECRLLETKEWQSRATQGKASGLMLILEGVNFWVREDAINEERNMIDLKVGDVRTRISYLR
jgi:flavin reductase (DIM6/NTAB) family NADH-FMN oxidoreductase RutF